LVSGQTVWEHPEIGEILPSAERMTTTVLLEPESKSVLYCKVWHCLKSCQAVSKSCIYSTIEGKATFMKLNHIDLLSRSVKWTGIAGVSLLSLLISLPVGAQGQLNPNPSIFNEPPYAGKPRVSPGEVTPAPAPAQTPDPTPTETPVTPPTQEKPAPGSESGRQDVISLAEANGSFKTLISALKAAGLVETLQGEGPFTIFAPSDAAFAKLPQDALKELISEPRHRDALRKILTYHVVPGQVLSSDIKPGKVKTVEGNTIDVKVNGASGVMVNDSKVVQPDIKGSNGVIHVIDSVLLPPDV